MKKKVIYALTVVLFAGIFLAMQPAIQAEAKTKISKTKATLCTGETLQLKLKGTKAKVQWQSNKKSVAVVNKKGLVTAKKRGTCKIQAKCGGKKYFCKLTVKKLPKNYATVNGKKVKVGAKVKITYTITSDFELADVSGRYYYYGDQLKVVTSDEHKMRFKTWWWNNGFGNQPAMEDQDMSPWEGMTKGEKPLYSFYQCWGLDPNKEILYDPYPISCKNGKEFDSFYVKVLAHGNFTFKSTFDARAAQGTNRKCTVKETIK